MEEETLKADVNGVSYRLKAGQDFINEEMGAEYMADKNKIRGSDVKLFKPIFDNYGRIRYYYADGLPLPS